MSVKLIEAGAREIASQIAELEEMIFSDPWSAGEIEKTLEQKHSLCAVAEAENQVVGYFLCYYVLDECEIARIAVHSDRRRDGVGRKLMSFLVAECKKRQVAKILLDVRIGNDTAIAFYEKMGFVRDGVRKGYYGGNHPEDALLMSLDICCFPV